MQIFFKLFFVFIKVNLQFSETMLEEHGEAAHSKIIRTIRLQ
jgi:hypothetical protein